MKQKTMVWFAVAAVLALCVFVAGRGADYLDKAEGPDFFTEHEGVLYSKEGFHLEPGRYTVAAQFTGSAELFATSPLEATKDAIEGLVFASTGVVSKSGAITITVDKPTWEVSLRFADMSEDFSLAYIHIQSAGRVYNDTPFLCLLILLAAAALYLLWRRSGTPGLPQKGVAISPFAIAVYICAAALLVSLPYMQDFLFYGDDVPFQMTRIEGIYEGLLAGQFPVRINPVFTNNIGYADATMYPNLLLYIPGLLRLAGVSLLTAYQFYIVLIHFGTMALGYYCFTQLTGSRFIGLCSATLYLFGGYRLFTLLNRGAVGEYTAMLFLPATALGMYQLLHTEKPRVRWLVLGLTGIFTANTLTVIMCVFLCGLYALCNIQALVQRSRLFALLKAVGIFLLLNAWCLVPFLYYSATGLGAFTQDFSPAAHAAWPAQMVLFQIAPANPGFVLLVGAVLYLASRFAAPHFYAQNPRLRKISTGMLLCALFTLFLASKLFPWDAVQRIPLLGFVLSTCQFPWRYFTLTTLFLAVPGAIGIAALAKTNKARVVSLAAVLCVCLFAAGSAFQGYTRHTGDIILADKFTAQNYNYNVHYAPDYYRTGADVPTLLRQPTNAQPAEGISVAHYEKRQTNITLTYNAENGGTIDVPLYYYPGYTARLGDGTLLALGENEVGLARITLPAGQSSGSITLSYTSLPLFRVAEGISLLSALGLLAWAILRRRGKTQKTQG